MPPQWTFGICGIAGGLALAVLLTPHADITAKTGVIQLANNLVVGAFGAAAGAGAHALLTSRKTTVDGDPGVKIEEETLPPTA